MAPLGATGHCALTRLCTFQITIKNIGDAPFTGVLHLKDTVGPGTPVRILKGGGFGTCSQARNTQGAGGIAVTSIDCDIGPFPEGIKPNDTVQLEVLVEAGRSWGSDKNLKNCAELSGETDMGPPETRKKDCAEVKLDPFDVGVAKTGDQSCQPGGECRFDIDIFNPNKSVIHDDPVTVTDKLSGLSSAKIVSITPVDGAQDFPCKPQPTQVPFSCTGHMKLLPGNQNHYTMILRLPADASAASFSNCASGWGTPFDRGETSDPSCHAVQLAQTRVSAVQPQDRQEKHPAPVQAGMRNARSIFTLTNTGNQNHAGALTLTDGLADAPSMRIVSIDPPLPCTAQPDNIPFNCKMDGRFHAARRCQADLPHQRARTRSAEANFTNCAILGARKDYTRESERRRYRLLA